MNRRIETEELPPLPDDIDAAATAKVQAEQRSYQARESEFSVLRYIDEVSEMRRTNGWGPMLELAFKLRG